MNATEILRLLDSFVARALLSREDHGRGIEATKVLQMTLLELGNLRQEVDRLQAEIERLQSGGDGKPAEA